MSTQNYDVVIIGAGLSGALLAWSLTQSKPGLKVLLLEAGPGALDANGNVDRQRFIDTFYAAPNKFPESPYTPGKGAPSADIADLAYWNDPSKSYLTYTPGSISFRSTYERLQGGTMLHWLGTALRFNPSDFKLFTKYLSKQQMGSSALDWPISYADLEPFYEQAEAAIGVAANVQDQTYEQGPPYRAGYEYPMPPITPSFLDEQVAKKVNGFIPSGVDAETPLTVRSTPQGRNSRTYNGRPPCMGNTNCVPLCPIGAKYDPLFHLQAAMRAGAVVQVESVAFNLTLGADGKITGVQYKTYDGKVQPPITGKLYVVAAHAIESAKLLLLSNRANGGLANDSKQVGCNLMDHNTQLSWALMPADTPVHGYRGPISTSGIEDLRDGSFRSQRGAFRIEIGNEGWNWPTGAPFSDAVEMVTGGLIGARLRKSMNDRCTRQIRVASLVEPIGVSSNRVQLSDQYTDAIGIPRPLITYKLQEYETRGLEVARRVALELFRKLGATDQTSPDSASPAGFQGAGHILGTARMGSDSKTSVTNSYGQTWQHPNLFVVGAPLFPSVSCVNPSLTLAALTLRTADHLAKTWSSSFAGL